MKKHTLYTALGLMLFFSCHDEKKEANVSSDHKTSSTINSYKIDSAKAVKWTENWRQFASQHPEDSLRNAFLIHNSEIFELLNIQPQATSRHMRVYMGLTDDAIPLHKTILVAVDQNGNDLFNYSEGYYAYDFDFPCPTLCGNSPLNQ